MDKVLSGKIFILINLCETSLTRYVKCAISSSAVKLVFNIIKGSIEPTRGSVCSDVRKLQSMDVLKLQGNKEDWNTKCPSAF